MSELQILLEWSYTPPGFFEETVAISRQDYTMVIGNGKAEVTIAAALYDANPSMRDDLSQSLRTQFRAVQLLTHQPFKLENPTIVRYGGKDISVELRSESVRVVAGLVDTRVTDGQENIISDSRRDRIAREGNWADRVRAQLDDALLMKLLTSHENSVNEPANELTRLYEIRDALATGSETKVKRVRRLTFQKTTGEDSGTCVTSNHCGKGVIVTGAVPISEMPHPANLKKREIRAIDDRGVCAATRR